MADIENDPTEEEGVEEGGNENELLGVPKESPENAEEEEEQTVQEAAEDFENEDEQESSTQLNESNENATKPGMVSFGKDVYFQSNDEDEEEDEEDDNESRRATMEPPDGYELEPDRSQSMTMSHSEEQLQVQPTSAEDINEEKSAHSQLLGSYGADIKGLFEEQLKKRGESYTGSEVSIHQEREKSDVKKSSFDETEGECDGEDDTCDYDFKWAEFPGEEDVESWESISYGTSSPLASAQYIEEIYEVPVTPPRVPSEEAFQQTYLNTISETEAREALSREVLRLEPRRLTPSPPSTPKKTLRRMHECPSVESFLKLGDPVLVNFYVLPGQKLFSVEVRLDRTIADLKHDISPICKVPPEFIDIRRNRNLVMDYKTLKDLGAKPHKKMKFTIEVSKRCPLDYKLKIPVENKIERFPTVQTRVKVQTDKGLKHVKLTIEFASERKMFIGGYRDKRTNMAYHHAITQTPFYSEPYSDKVQHFSCQTFDNTWKTMQTLQDTYQQTYRPDYHVSSIKDKIVWARPYLHSEYLQTKRIKAAIIIQKYWRRWLAIRERAERLDGLIRRVEWAENIRKGRTESRLAIKEDEMWRQHHPAKLVDVELLYRAINEWRRDQVEYIGIHRWGPDRKAALAVIMEKEADLLLDLERTKTTIKNATYDTFIESIYRKMGNPTRWLNRSGNFVALDNKGKYDMRQYHRLYNTLKEPVMDMDTRCLLLDKLTSYVKAYNSDLSQYLITLIGREKILMERKAGEHLLIGLRQRIMNIFYHLLRDPLFNPEARKLQKVPFDSTKLRKDMIQCKGCRKMQYRDQFTVVRGVTVTTRCVTCMALYRTCILRSDLNLYRRMLSELRHDEQSAGIESSVTYLIDAYDIQFLIEQLWHGQSALSGIDDRYLLRLCRWKRNFPWTPWNCVLLTEEESVAHLHLEDMSSAYQKSFFHKVHVKHQGARIYFARLTTLAIPLDPALETYCSNLKKERLLAKKMKKKIADTK